MLPFFLLRLHWKKGERANNLLNLQDLVNLFSTSYRFTKFLKFSKSTLFSVEPSNILKMSAYKEYQSQWLQELNVYVENNLDSSTFSVTDLAFHMNLSQSSLYRKMKTITKLSPSEYIKSKKLERVRIRI